MNPDLRDIFRTVNEWLKFAEAKNGVLLTIELAFMGWLIGPTPDGLRLTSLSRGMIGSAIAVAAALVVALLSFWPLLKVLACMERGIGSRSTQSNSLVYFGDIARYDRRSYVNAIRERYAWPLTSPVDLDLAEQIVTNSKIALRKFRLFTLSLILFAVSVAVTATSMMAASGSVLSSQNASSAHTHIAPYEASLPDLGSPLLEGASPRALFPPSTALTNGNQPGEGILDVLREWRLPDPFAEVVFRQLIRREGWHFGELL